uniref:Uncharacterized protein n=1 Tax=Panagrellus redivivus TaxID=6233 RepID=A0A7E5A0A6_PANRE
MHLEEDDLESEDYDFTKRLRSTLITGRVGLVQASPGFVTQLTHSGICFENTSLYARDCTFTQHDLRSLLTRANPISITFTECRMTEPFSFLELWRLCGSFRDLHLDIANLTFEPDFERRLADSSHPQQSLSTVALFRFPVNTDLKLLFSAVYKSSSTLPTLTLQIDELIPWHLLQEAIRPIQAVFKMHGRRDLLVMSGHGCDATTLYGS